MVKRILIYCAGVLILALGLVLNSKTGLGVSAVLCLPFALSKITSLSFGTLTTILYLVFVAAQLAMTRKADMAIILQLPFSVLFGWIIDFYNLFIKIENPSLITGLCLLAAAVVLTALGVVMMVSMNLIINPADGFSHTISKITGKPFGTVKLIADISLVCLTAVVCMILVQHLIGIGLGTVVSAVCIGPLINFFTAKFSGPLIRMAGMQKTKAK